MVMVTGSVYALTTEIVNTRVVCGLGRPMKLRTRDLTINVHTFLTNWYFIRFGCIKQSQ